MSKLFKLKKFLTLDEAAVHLSSAMSEQVSKADILRLALDSELVLSVYFVEGVLGKFGRAIPLGEAPKVPGTQYQGLPPHEVTLCTFLNEKEVLLFDGPVRSVEGIYDLPMIGGEQDSCEALYQKLINGPAVEQINPDGVFLRVPGKDCYVQLYYPYLPSPKLGDSHEPWESHSELIHVPEWRLPNGTIFVVRSESMTSFLGGFVNEVRADKLLSTRERNTLLTIIGTLCKEAKIDYTKTSKAAGLIASTASKMGVSIGETTIEGHLKKVPEALGSRMQ